MASVTTALPYKIALLLLLVPLAGCRGSGSDPQIDNNWIEGPVVATVDLFGVAFMDDRSAWAVGDIGPGGEGGAMFFSSDAGQSWRPAIQTTEILTSLSFVDARTGWAAGYAGRVQKTTDGGATWVKQRFERENEILNSIFFLDQQNGWAAGCDGLLLQTTDGGKSWSQSDTPVKVDFWCVRFSRQDRGWLAGEDGTILSSSDRGQTWSQQPTGTIEALTGIAIGASGTIVVAGGGGTVLRSGDGEHWEHIESAKDRSFNAVAAGRSGTFWAVGSKGTIIRSIDDGRTWSDMSKGNAGLTSIDLRGPYGLAVGDRGTTLILRLN